MFSQPHQIFLHILPGNTFWYKTPKNQILNFSLLKNTEKFHYNNTRPTWPESPSNIMKIMYGHQNPMSKILKFANLNFLH